MATRKPLFMNQTEGYHEQMANADDIVLGGLQINTGGTGIDLNHSPLINLDPPVNPEDAATKAYVDAVASGLDVHESCRVKTKIGLGTQAKMTGADGTGVSDLDTHITKITLNGGTQTTVTFQAADNTMQKVCDRINTAMGVDIATFSGNNVILTSNYYGAHSQIVVANTDTEVHDQVGIHDGTYDGTGFTEAGAGVGKTLEAPDVNSDWNVIDGKTLAVDDRVLVTCEGGADTIADKANGIYKVVALGNDDAVKFKLERTTDCDAASPTEFHQGTYTFIWDGDTYINTGWTCTTVIVTVDTTPNVWTQFSGAVSYSFDQGLKKIVSSVQVDLDNGADAQGEGYPVTDRKSGLEFDADTAAGQLRVAVAAAGGLERYQDSPYGLGIKLNGATLNLSSSGIKVTDNTFAPYSHVHAHSDLTGVTADQHHAQAHGITSGDHTASGLTTGYVLTATGATTFGWAAPGASSEAPRVENTYSCAGGTVSKSDPVYLSANDTVDEADCSTDAKSRVIGIARTAPSSNLVEVVTVGPCAGVLTSATVNTPYYLADGGGLTTSVAGIPGNHRLICVGYAINETDLFVEIKDYGKKAA